MICKLLKSIYSLKQSFRAWYERLDAFDIFLFHINLKKTKVDPNIYVKFYANANNIILAIFVDDGITTKILDFPNWKF
jgi:hypothetical protein